MNKEHIINEPKFQVIGTITDYSLINGFNGDYKLRMIISYRTTNKTLIHRGEHIISTQIYVAILNCTNPESFVGKTIQGTLSLPHSVYNLLVLNVIKIIS